MKSLKLQNFLKLHLEANAIVLLTPTICDLISFNKQLKIDDYREFLAINNDEASSIHLKALMKSNGNVKDYLKFLQKQFTDTLNEFIEKDGFLIHKKLIIKDRQENEMSFEELTQDVKSKISSFISVQKSSLTCFLQKLDISENNIPATNLKWNGTHIDLTELSNALFEGSYVISENGALTKKEFMKLFSNFFNVNLTSWEVTLNKAMSRENPAKFIDNLKATISNYNENLININKR
jgi:hypothetical protein